jgi:hypothetical protein
MAESISCIFCSSKYFNGQNLIDHIHGCSSIPKKIKQEYIKDVEKSLKPKSKFKKKLFRTSSDIAQIKLRNRKEETINPSSERNDFTQNSIYAILTPTGNKR